jgi:hypothetical protein
VGYFLLWVAFLKISEVAHIFGRFFPHYGNALILAKKCSGQHFGRYFSTTRPAALCTEEKKPVPVHCQPLAVAAPRQKSSVSLRRANGQRL